MTRKQDGRSGREALGRPDPRRGDIPSGGYVRVDPKLQQGSDGVYRLSAGSPAIGAATLSGVTVAEDIDGHARGAGRDVGADEYTTAAPVRRPLTVADVGPNAS